MIGRRTICAAAIGVLTLTGAPTAYASRVSPSQRLATAVGQHISINYVLAVSGSPFYEAMQCGAKAEGLQLHVNIKFSAPGEFAPSQQLPLLDAAVSSHPNAIIMVPTDPTALDSWAAATVSKHIKVVTADETLGNAKSIVTTQVLSNSLAGGAEVATEMAKELAGHGDVFVVTSPPGLVTTQDQRVAGFLRALKKYPGLHYVGAQYNNDDPAVVSSEVREELSKDPKLAGIFASNDQSGIGAISGLKGSHATGRVKIFEYDSAVSDVQDLRSGAVQGLVAQEPRLEGVDAVKYAVEAVQGKRVPKLVETPTRLLTNTTPVSIDTQYEYKGSC